MKTDIRILLAGLALSATPAHADTVASGGLSVDTRDYTLAVASDRGTPDPPVGTHLYAWRSTVICTNSRYAIEGQDSYVCGGWGGAGSVPVSGSKLSTGDLVLSEASSAITWHWGDDTDDDGDGLLNGFEVLVHHTDPDLRDTDGDYFNDGDEIARGWNPGDPGDGESFSAQVVDTFVSDIISQQAAGLFTEDSIRDIRMRTAIRRVDPQSNEVEIELQLEYSDDGKSWHNLGDLIQVTDTVQDKAIYRFVSPGP